MNSTTKQLFVVATLLIGSAWTAHAGGQLPPPTTPKNFIVDLSSNVAFGHWDSTPDVGYFVFTMTDTGDSVGANGDAAGAVLSGLIDPSVPHHFTLVATNNGGSSDAAVFDYAPPAKSTGTPVHPSEVTYQFSNQASSGTPVSVTISVANTDFAPYVFTQSVYYGTLSSTGVGFSSGQVVSLTVTGHYENGSGGEVSCGTTPFTPGLSYGFIFEDHQGLTCRVNPH